MGYVRGSFVLPILAIGLGLALQGCGVIVCDYFVQKTNLPTGFAAAATGMGQWLKEKSKQDDGACTGVVDFAAAPPTSCFGISEGAQAILMTVSTYANPSGTLDFSFQMSDEVPPIECKALAFTKGADNVITADFAPCLAPINDLLADMGMGMKISVSDVTYCSDQSSVGAILGMMEGTEGTFMPLPNIACPVKPTPAPLVGEPAQYSCQAKVGEDCCEEVRDHGLWVEKVDVGVLTRCDQRDKEYIEHGEWCDKSPPTCENDEDSTRFSNSCTADIEASTVGCGKPSPERDCVYGRFGQNYTDRCTGTLTTLVFCGVDHAMECIDILAPEKPCKLTPGGMANDECKECLQNQMIKYCVAPFEAASGIKACPPTVFPDSFWTALGNAAAEEAKKAANGATRLYMKGPVVGVGMAGSNFLLGFVVLLSFGLMVAFRRRAHTSREPRDDLLADDSMVELSE